MKSILPLNKGINLDSNPIYVQSEKGEVLERRNCRVVSVNEGENFVNVSLRGMESIGTTTGLGTVVGYVEDKKRDFGIYFLKDGDYGRIYAYRQRVGDVVKILDNNFNFFKFDQINARIIGDTLVWTDNVNPVRCINIERAYKFSNNISANWKDIYQEITDANTRLSIPTPSDTLYCAFGHDESRDSNFIYNKTYQFAVLYKYKDDEKSVLSSYSDVLVHPSMLIGQDTINLAETENYIEFDVPLGDSEVVSAVLYAKENNGLFYEVKEFKKNAYYEVVYANYRFYNDTSREYISADIALLINQNIPQKAAYIETAKNRLILGNPTTNYDHPTDVSITAEAVKSPFTIGSYVDTISSVTTDDVDKGKFRIDMRNLKVDNGFMVIMSIIGFVDCSIGLTGDANDYDAKFYFGFTRKYLSTSDNNTAAAIQYLYDELVKADEDLIYDIEVYRKGTNTPEDVDKVNVTVTRTLMSGKYVIDVAFSAGSGVDRFYKHGVVIETDIIYSRSISNEAYKNLNTYIDGSSYGVGVEYMDDFGYTSGVEAETIVNVPFSPTKPTLGTVYPSAISLELHGTPPSWATKYRIVCTKSLNFASILSFYTETSYIIEYNDRIATAILMPKLFSYAFSDGDYINTSYIGTSGITDPYFTGIRILGTSSIVQANGESLSGNYLVVDANIDLNYRGRTAGKGFVYIYRPIPSTEEKIYYQTNTLSDIAGGVHTVTAFTIKNGDAYWCLGSTDLDALYKRDVDSSAIKYGERKKKTVDYMFMSSIIDGVSSYNIGKPTVSLADFKQQTLTELWYGGQIIENTGINGIRDFSNNGRLAMSESDGEITGLHMVGDVLKVMQENKETSVYIGKEQILNADGTMQLVSSQGYLSTVNRYNSDYGSIHPRSIVSNERDLYYFDHHNGAVVRSSPNGQFEISKYNFVSYFKEKASQVTNAIRNGLTNNIYGFYDRNYGEYWMVFDISTKSGIVVTNHREAVVFNETLNAWTSFIDLTKSGNIAEFFGTIGVETLSFINGTLWLHDKTSVFNSLYSENKTLLVRGALNVSPTIEKGINAILIDASKSLNTVIESPISENNVIGQKTVLYPETYEHRQGVFVSEVFRNILTTVGDDLNQLYVGDDVQGRYVTIELTDTSNDKVELRDIGVTYLPMR